MFSIELSTAKKYYKRRFPSYKFNPQLTKDLAQIIKLYLSDKNQEKLTDELVTLSKSYNKSSLRSHLIVCKEYLNSGDCQFIGKFNRTSYFFGAFHIVSESPLLKKLNSSLESVISQLTIVRHKKSCPNIFAMLALLTRSSKNVLLFSCVALLAGPTAAASVVDEQTQCQLKTFMPQETCPMWQLSHTEQSLASLYKVRSFPAMTTPLDADVFFLLNFHNLAEHYNYAEQTLETIYDTHPKNNTQLSVLFEPYNAGPLHRCDGGEYTFSNGYSLTVPRTIRSFCDTWTSREINTGISRQESADFAKFHKQIEDYRSVLEFFYRIFSYHSMPQQQMTAYLNKLNTYIRKTNHLMLNKIITHLKYSSQVFVLAGMFHLLAEPRFSDPLFANELDPPAVRFLHDGLRQANISYVILQPH